MQKRILLSLLWGVIFSLSLFSQNLKAEKITLPDSKLNNLYKIDSGVYRSEQPSHSDFKALEKYGIGESLNLRNRHSDNDEATGTTVKLHRVKMKAHSVDEEQLITALRIIRIVNRPLSFIVIMALTVQESCVLFTVLYSRMSLKKMQFVK